MLDRATWMQSVTAGAACGPDHPPRTLYFVDGGMVYESECGAVLDVPSRNAVDRIAAIVVTARNH